MRIIPDTNWNTSETYILTDKDLGKMVEGYIHLNSELRITSILDMDIDENKIHDEWHPLTYFIKWRFVDENNA